KLARTITQEDADRLENVIDDLQKDVTLKREFIYPGETVISAQIDVARTVVRRSERKAALLKSEGIIKNPLINQYLNRLADMLFTLARYEEGQAKS
ncbi:MAG: ATP:cob(I)alamin adenosyltransferase, partial [Deltaproteobacteria bacterium]|nr:ATP:cob(I)alamin adenosyltransferase [Deltaproteobacteria bacterium]